MKSKKINLATMYLHGENIFKMNRVTPSAEVVHKRILDRLNDEQWETLSFKTTIDALAGVAHLKPVYVRNALKELIDLSLIVISYEDESSDSSSTRNPDVNETYSTRSRDVIQMSSTCSRDVNETYSTRSRDVIQTYSKRNPFVIHLLCESCSDATLAPKSINQSNNQSNKCEKNFDKNSSKKSNAEKLLKKLENVELFDDRIEYAQPEIPIKDKLHIDCIKYDINKLVDKGLPFSVTGEKLLRSYKLTTRRFIELYM